MVTKWKKSKIIVSFGALVLGVALLIVNFFSMLLLMNDADLVGKKDYQETQAFAGFVSGRLEDFIGIGLYGKDWYSYGYNMATESGTSYQSFDSSAGDFGWFWDFWGATASEAETNTAERVETETSVAEEDSAYAESGYDKEKAFEDYLAYLSADKNIRYAVYRNQELLYTNVDELEGQTGEKGVSADFKYASTEDCNFFLCYNGDGDGRVAIQKDGKTQDVYGNGIYTENSRWYVPGYSNFQAKDEMKEVVVWIAAAREPKLYVEADYAKGTAVRGEWLYYLQNSLLEVQKRVKLQGILLVVNLLLLVLAFVLRRERREARRRLRDGMRRLFRARDLRLSIQKRLFRRQIRLFFCAGLTWLVLGAGYLVWMLEYSWLWNAGGLLFLTAVFLLCTALVFGVGLTSLGKNRRLAEDIGALAAQIQAVRDGRLTEDLRLPEDTDLLEMTENLHGIGQGLERALAERTKSERMKVELVANVSHDIKTPLTSIVSYVELLKQEENLPEHVRDYIRILGEKSERLGSMVQDIFEVSKAASGQLPVKLEKLDFGKLLRQTLADMNGQIEESGLQFRVSIPEEAVPIRADGQRMYRVFQNLLQNVLKYSLQGSRVYLSLTVQGAVAQAVIKNTSGTELGEGVDFTERFVRGDKSRTDGGSGLGLSIARSFTEACGGQFSLETDADLFTVRVTFQVEGE